MVLGISKIDWIESLTRHELKEYFNYIDKLVVVVDSKDDEWTEDETILYRAGDYRDILNTLQYWALCKAYPRKCLYSVNYSLIEITDGLTPDILRRRWEDELRNSGLLRRAL